MAGRSSARDRQMALALAEEPGFTEMVSAGCLLRSTLGAWYCRGRVGGARRLEQQQQSHMLRPLSMFCETVAVVHSLVTQWCSRRPSWIRAKHQQAVD